MKLYQRIGISIVATILACSGLVSADGPGQSYFPVILRGRPDPLPTAPSVAFVYNSSPAQPGWNWTHDQGRLMLERELGSATTYVVDQNPAAEAVIRQLAQRGYDLVVTTSFEYMNPTVNVASEFPNTWFVNIGGQRVAANVSAVNGRMYQPSYLAGIVAGSMTQTNRIGYVVNFPIPETYRNVNAFTLGARSVNPAARVFVLVIFSFYDPPREREAAQMLLDLGADVLASNGGTSQPQQAARERGALSIGHDYDMAAYLGNTVLTSVVWNWGVKYVDIARKIAEGRYASENYWGRMADRVVDLTPMSSRVPPAVASHVQSERNRIMSGANQVFVGPLYDTFGNLCVPDGQVMTDQQLLNMNWFVQGVSAQANRCN